jgi:hypothetical protein
MREDREEILGLPVALPDGVDYDEYVIGTYLVSYPAALPIPLIAPMLAVEQSTGTWVPVPGETLDVRCQHIDGIRTAQVVTFQAIVLLLNPQVEQQRRHRSDTRPLADAQ